MSNKPAILILLFIVGIAAAVGADKNTRAAVRDGFILAGIDGKLVTQDSNETSQARPDRCFFKFDSDVTDGIGRLEAGTQLELLPSATLEKMLADANDRPDAGYKLWARVTKYKDENFIFPTYFLPTSQAEPTPQQEEPETAINKPNEALTVPKQILDKLKTRKIIPQEQLKGLELKHDSILVNRTGFIVKQPKPKARYDSFALDGLGRSIQQTSLQLLPCEALEQAQQRQSAEPETLRFKVAGIVTKYKGEYYLLLQRAKRVYSHENFGR